VHTHNRCIVLKTHGAACMPASQLCIVMLWVTPCLNIGTAAAAAAGMLLCRLRGSEVGWAAP
jgi:hypothetical protein